MSLFERVPPHVWLAGAAAAGLAVLVVHHWHRTRDAGESWLDPQQPAVNLDLVRGAALRLVADAAPPPVPLAPRAYPDSLSCWSGSWIGDC